MSRRRYISTDVSIDKRLNRLAVEHGDFAALLYTWMVPHAGDDATLNGDVDELIATVIPHRRDKTANDVKAALVAMCSAGLIQWDGATIYFPIEAFYRYQTYIKVENRRGGNPCSTPPAAEEQRETPENAVSLPLSVSPSVPPSLSVPRAGRARKPAVIPLTEEERAQLHSEEAKYPQWDGPGDIDAQIELAASHESAKKYPENQLGYIRNWLRRERGWRAERRNGNGRPRHTNQHGNPDDEDPIAKRIRLDRERAGQPGLLPLRE